MFEGAKHQGDEFLLQIPTYEYACYPEPPCEKFDNLLNEYFLCVGASGRCLGGDPSQMWNHMDSGDQSVKNQGEALPQFGNNTQAPSAFSTIGLQIDQISNF